MKYEFSSGEEFEQFIIAGLREAGLYVTDTPRSGDYGADLVFEYKGNRFAGQCKYYSGTVGLKAVQEVLGSLSYYEASFGIVFTNSSFTQQAKNLASVNNVLLIDEKGLESFSYNSTGIPMFDVFLHGKNSNVCSNEIWTTKDLTIRYGLSASKIMKDFMSRGLPYRKVGREYQFDPNAVKKWEIEERRIPYGKKGVYVLPEYIRYGKILKEKLKQAKKEGDSEKARKIRKLRWQHGYMNKYIIRVIILIIILIGSYFLFSQLSSIIPMLVSEHNVSVFHVV